MHHHLKTLLLWFLLATLPIQGFAAAVKVSCGPSHHHTLLADAASSHHHDDDAMHSQADSQSRVSIAVNKSPDTHQHESAFCSACAACSVGAVAPPYISVLTPTYDDSLPAVIAPALLVTDHIPASLERPPRFISA